VAECERTEERAQPGRGPDPGEQPTHSAVPQPIKIIDRVRPSQHPRPTAAVFSAAFGFGTVSAAAVSYSPHRRTRAGTGTKPAEPTRFGIIERHRDGRNRMRELHFRGVLTGAANRTF